MAFSNRMTKYEAPEGYVYDWVKPHISIETAEDGSEHEVENHLYVKYLFLTKQDDINSYQLVPQNK